MFVYWAYVPMMRNVAESRSGGHLRSHSKSQPGKSTDVYFVHGDRQTPGL